MKIATAKCNGNMPMSVPTPSIGSLKLAIGPSSMHDFSSSSTTHHQQHQQHQAKPQEEAPFSKTQPSIDINKLQQAILAGYNKHLVNNNRNSYLKKLTLSCTFTSLYWNERFVLSPYYILYNLNILFRIMYIVGANNTNTHFALYT